MKEKTIKAIKGISIAVLVMIALETGLDTYFWSERWRNVEWNAEIIGWQRRIIISNIVTTYLLAAVMVTFKTNHVRKEGQSPGYRVGHINRLHAMIFRNLKNRSKPHQTLSLCGI